MRRPLLASLLLPGLVAIGVIAGCSTFPGHPVLLSQPRRTGPLEVRSPGVPEPEPISAERAAAALFHGLEGIVEPLEVLRRQPVTDRRKPQLVRIKRMERSVLKRYRRGGFGGAVRTVVVLGVIGTLPLTPAQAADLITDAEVERAVLGADAMWHLSTVYALPNARRERYRVHLLDRGEGPLRFDLRASVAFERRDSPDGRVLLRYDPDTQPRPEHITLFRGACVLDPVPGGTRVTEILILGTDIQLLPFIQGELVDMVLKTMRDRATNLWARAWRGR